MWTVTLPYYLKLLNVKKKKKIPIFKQYHVRNTMVWPFLFFRLQDLLVPHHSLWDSAIHISCSFMNVRCFSTSHRLCTSWYLFSASICLSYLSRTSIFPPFLLRWLLGWALLCNPPSSLQTCFFSLCSYSIYVYFSTCITITFFSLSLVGWEFLKYSRL